MIKNTGLNSKSSAPGISSARVVVLDLDGTITVSDTLIPFLIGCYLRNPRFKLRLLLLPMDIVFFLLGRLDSTQFKERLLIAFLGGLQVASVENWAIEFARRIVESGCNSKVLSLMKQSQARGDRLIILSASPDIYVRFIAQALGIHETISTKTEIRSGKYTGKLIGRNCKGAEKLRRLEEYLGSNRHEAMTIAVGNEEADLPVLGWADQSWMVRNGDLVLLGQYERSRQYEKESRYKANTH